MKILLGVFFCYCILSTAAYVGKRQTNDEPEKKDTNTFRLRLKLNLNDFLMGFTPVDDERCFYCVKPASTELPSNYTIASSSISGNSKAVGRQIKWINLKYGYRASDHCYFPGFTIATYDSDSLDDCFERCLNDSCRYFNWNRRESKCHIKDSTGVFGHPYLSNGDAFCGGEWLYFLTERTRIEWMVDTLNAAPVTTSSGNAYTELIPTWTRSLEDAMFSRYCDFFGHDIVSYDYIEMDECIERCKDMANCSYFTWNRRHSKCFLKKEAGQKGRPHLSHGEDFCGGWWNGTAVGYEGSAMTKIPDTEKSAELTKTYETIAWYRDQKHAAAAKHCSFSGEGLVSFRNTGLHHCIQSCEREEDCLFAFGTK